MTAATTRPRRTTASSPSAVADSDPRWTAVASRDRSADGRFVYAVRTTGVYCRPSCAARRALARNVVFFDTPRAARAAGYRPCLRCRPDGARADTHLDAAVVAACRTLDASDRDPPLAALARAAGMSPWHFQRVFKARTGVSPKQYYKALRARRVGRALARAATVTEAIHDAGYGSAARFYAEGGTPGMRATTYLAGAAGETIRYAIAPTSLGPVLVAATARGVCAVEFGDDAATLAEVLRARFPHATRVEGDRGFRARVAAVVGAIEEPRAARDLPLDVRGTAFQRRVWGALRAIPAAATTTYADLARALGAPRAVRAVARACAANPVAVVVPCHRVVRSDGALAGYRWGLERKAELLRREAAGAAAAPAKRR